MLLRNVKKKFLYPTTPELVAHIRTGFELSVCEYSNVSYRKDQEFVFPLKKQVIGIMWFLAFSSYITGTNGLEFGMASTSVINVISPQSFKVWLPIRAFKILRVERMIRSNLSYSYLILQETLLVCVLRRQNLGRYQKIYNWVYLCWQ